MPQSVLMSLHMPAAAYARLKRKTARVGVLSITSGDAIGVGGELRVGASQGTAIAADPEDLERLRLRGI